MTLESIGESHRVPVRRDDYGDRIIKGKNGHLYLDQGRVMVCYTDDGRKKPLGARKKTNALKALGTAIVKVKQEAHAEFVAEIHPEGIKTALFKVLMVRRFRIDHGISREFGARPANQGTLLPEIE